jgi:hypothetical protein
MTASETKEYHRKWRLSHQENIQRYRKNTKEKRRVWNGEWRESHKDKYREWVQKWRVDNPERTREIDGKATLKKRHGITLEDYARMLKEQGGCCEICGRPSTDYKRSLHVDHDHSTGKVRGLLCVKCNSGIGYFCDNTALLENAKSYLLKYAGLEKVKDFC